MLLECRLGVRHANACLARRVGRLSSRNYEQICVEMIKKAVIGGEEQVVWNISAPERPNCCVGKHFGKNLQPLVHVIGWLSPQTRDQKNAWDTMHKFDCQICASWALCVLWHVSMHDFDQCLLALCARPCACVAQTAKCQTSKGQTRNPKPETRNPEP